MCNLQSEPWRADFTGPPCMCGVPTAGTEEERLIDRYHRAEKQKQQKEARQKEFAEYREQRINELYTKLGYDPNTLRRWRNTGTER